MRPVLVIFILLLTRVTAFGQTPSQRFAEVLDAFERREYASAIERIGQIEREHPQIFQVNNLDYLTARLHQRAGDSAKAAAYFQKVRGRNSILREYATWHLGAIARENGNLLAERILLLELLTERPGSLLADAARRRRAESYLESKDFDAAIDSIQGFPGSGERARDVELLFAKALLFKDQKGAARQKFESVISSTANPSQPDDLALEAVKAIDLIEVGPERFGKQKAQLSDYEHLKRATIYQFNRDFVDARLHFLAIVNDHPTSGLVPDALYQIGRGYSQTSDFTEAVRWYERVGELHPQHPVNKDALLQLASAYARLHKYREAVSRYERYIATYPDDERIDRAYLNIVDVLRDAGEETDALNRADRAAEFLRGRVGEAQAIFAKVRIRIARADWSNAVPDLDRLLTLNDLGGARIPGGTTRAEVTFLRGLALEELRRFPEAIDAYLSIPDGRNEYYGWRATQRLGAMLGDAEKRAAVEAKLKSRSESGGQSPETRKNQIHDALRMTSDETQRKRLLDELRDVYAQLPGYKLPTLPKPIEVGRKDLRIKSGTQAAASIADELAFLGLFDEAAPEYEAAVRGTSADSKKLSAEVEFTLARIYLKGDRGDRAVSFMEPLAKLQPDFHIELLPREIAEMLYPAPYRDALLKHATTRGVDPRFLLSIMRQESRFRPNVKSFAAARGLMQFISDTSNRIAGELGRQRFDQNELYNPSTAILFGSQYVSDLFKLFPNQPDAVAASYNGGEDNMKRWLGRSKSDQPGRYVPEIGFAQSKDYVWRVMSNYRVYQLLYDENLNRR